MVSFNRDIYQQVNIKSCNQKNLVFKSYRKTLFSFIHVHECDYDVLYVNNVDAILYTSSLQFVFLKPLFYYGAAQSFIIALSTVTKFFFGVN